MRLHPDIIHDWTCRLLIAVGHDPILAKNAADIFVSASLRGVGHHDISFLPQRLHWISEAGVNPKPNITCDHAAGAIEIWNGDHGLGEICCSHITFRAIELACQYGIGFATIHDSNHFLAASPYAEIGVSAQAMVLVFSNTDAGMSGPDGGKNLIGNNPFGFGVPRTNAPAIVADMCMAYSSLGNLRALANEGSSIPSWWGQDKNGNASTDPAALLDGGSVAPMARHKGFNLALMVEGLTGILSGGHTGNQVSPGGGINTHNQSVIAFDLATFGGAQTIGNRMDGLCKRLATDSPGLRFPGERSETCRQNAHDHGIEIPDTLYNELAAWTKRLNAGNIPVA